MRDGFLAQPVPASVIQDIVHCGLDAPSSKNAQPWRVHVVSDRDVLKQLADAVQTAKDADRYVPTNPVTGEARPGFVSTVAESAEILRKAALGLFIESWQSFSGGRAALAQASDEHRRSALTGYALDMIGIGALMQNMWLAAQAHGLGGVFMGDVMIAEEVIRSRLDMEGDLLGVLALGYTSRAALVPKAMRTGRVVHHS